MQKYDQEKKESDRPDNTFVELAIELPLERTFTYSVPEALQAQVCLGKRAVAPFGKRTVTGYILNVSGQAPADVKETKPIIDILDDRPIFDAKRLEFYRWLAAYYFAPIGSVFALINPPGMNIKSERTITLTEKGRIALQGSADLDHEILKCADKGLNLPSIIKRYKDRPVSSAITRLVAEGLLAHESKLKGGIFEKTVQFAAPIKAASGGLESLKKTPLQARILTRLLDAGEMSMPELGREFSGSADAVKKLAAKGLVSIIERRVFRDPLAEITPREADHESNDEQQAALDEIKKALVSGVYSPFLLYGVTGSGKTLVYLKAIEEAVRLGKKALFLVPEISLTPWPVAYLASRFPQKVAVAHSGLTPGQRTDEWERIAGGEAEVVVGARSALFAPIKDLGLIIVDEEHETSYKQEEGVRYNARDCSLMLGRYLGITVVLGSATPSVETFYNANTGKIAPLRLNNRVSGGTLPLIELADMRVEKGAVISEKLKGLLTQTFEGGRQSLLFLNRRGFAPSIVCKDCGKTFECLNCSVTLTMHKSKKSLKCHYCDMTMALPNECPTCKGKNLVHPGAGTEKVEEEVRALLPQARIGRMDRDTTQKKGSAKKIIDAMEDKTVDVLIGTQMVSKGHHFPGITLVGVISGDTSLALPDFRSSERTFQLITQAAGRAGRGDEAGEVIVQTLNSEHYSFKNALRHDYGSFYSEEIELRRELDYPPFSRLCCLKFEGLKDEKVASAAETLKRTATGIIGKKTGIVVLGPAPALIARVKNRYRWQMLIKGSDVKTLLPFLRALRNSFYKAPPAGVALTFDMDPQTIV